MLRTTTKETGIPTPGYRRYLGPPYAYQHFSWYGAPLSLRGKGRESSKPLSGRHALLHVSQPLVVWS